MNGFVRRHGLVTAGAASLFLLVVAPARAADAAREIAIADQHAGYAAAAKDVTMAHTHFHHVVNCLVGPAGAGYDAGQANPCASEGTGAIPDTADAARKQALQNAVAKALDGLKADDLMATRKTAGDISAILKGTM
jgi:hypothetical protein